MNWSGDEQTGRTRLAVGAMLIVALAVAGVVVVSLLGPDITPEELVTSVFVATYRVAALVYFLIYILPWFIPWKDVMYMVSGPIAILIGLSALLLGLLTRKHTAGTFLVAVSVVLIPAGLALVLNFIL